MGTVPMLGTEPMLTVRLATVNMVKCKFCSFFTETWEFMKLTPKIIFLKKKEIGHFGHTVEDTNLIFSGN